MNDRVGYVMREETNQLPTDAKPKTTPNGWPWGDLPDPIQWRLLQMWIEAMDELYPQADYRPETFQPGDTSRMMRRTAPERDDLSALLAEHDRRVRLEAREREAFTPVIKPRYTEPMPTNDWLNAHKMLAFYVTNKEAEEFRKKCAEAGISQSDAMREILTATREGGSRKSAT